MPIGPEQGQEKCRKLAAPIIAKIDKYIAENDHGQDELVIKVTVPQEISHYLKHLYTKAGWGLVRIHKIDDGTLGEVVLKRSNFE